ncbi:TetR/AcrR family transcriptional regulator [Streptomyces sp. VMFN-G11Ma]|jgi:AcrR family transcriptional regulator|uniref:TetR/AcrR family transcriptional regulator n=1 Tax=Streptomyces sp. VMFN-G11Ma TaxID=2135609 RepID=UPI000D388917|nr:TetR/AcrR family transcriptional regulator [Streptomyces sp. VMFN-G11Ma]PTM93973.1 TetR family transcriptional regulator [Streptomyces sp. VMFN-G11Ma]
MSRWEPNARERLAKAALELYSERGYERTTVAEIAKQAGLTERTFFRHYADKREVLFDGSNHLQDLFVKAVGEAPPSAAPIDVVAAALEAVSEVFVDRRPFARKRQAVITANAELRERELIKLASLSTALTEALRLRGIAEPAASLTAEAGIAVFRVGFERWVAPGEERPMWPLMREALAALKAVTAGA